jgi:hypothetical protein
MAAFVGARQQTVWGTQDARLDTNGSIALDGAALNLTGSVPPFILRGGSARLATAAGLIAGHDPRNGDAWPARIIPLQTVLITGRRNNTGANFASRSLRVTAVYRNSDRLTIAGYARDLAGNPLRAFQLQFIGETVQDHFFGSASDLLGVYVAYLDQGDSYAIYAFNTQTGITFRLERQDKTANQTNLVFRRVTKQGTGEGLYRQGV